MMDRMRPGRRSPLGETSPRLALALALCALSLVAAQGLAAESATVDRVLELLAERLALAPEVAAAKWRANAPIEDLPRERELLNIAAAATHSPDEVTWRRELLQAQLEASKVVQYESHRVWRAATQAPPAHARDIAADLRPALDRLTRDLLAAIDAADAALVGADRARLRAFRSATHPLPVLGGERAWRIAVAPLLTRRGSTPGGAASRLDAVTDAGVLRICTTGDYAPFSLWQAQRLEFEGSDIEMGRDLAGSLGADALFVRTTWASLLDDVVANRCDVAMGGVSITLDRQKRAFFSLPYLVDGKAPIARCEDAARFQTIAQIDQPATRVVVNVGGTNEAFAREHFGRARVATHPDNTTIFDEILAGRADVMVTDAVEARLQEKRRPGLCAVNPDRPFTYSEKAYLLPRGDTAFKAYVDQWLHLKIASGDHARLQERWLR